MYDLLIKNGLVVDGLRTKAYKALIGIKDGKIVKINPALEEKAKIVIDAENLIISPGFIDIHTHSDISFMNDDRSESKIYQGVTSEVVGQCGDSRFPFSEEESKDQLKFRSVLDFINKAEELNKRMSTNWIPFVGHNTLRNNVMGYEGREASKDEIKEMVDLLNREMFAGAWGLSLGLGYSPGIFSTVEELIALGEIIKKYEGMISSHMRNQGNKIYEALDEMFKINRITGAHVHIAHLKLADKEQWGNSEALLGYIREAQAEGINVTFDIYPYHASSSGITNVLPNWTLDGGVEKAAKRFSTIDRDLIMEQLEEMFDDKTLGERIYIISTNGMYTVADDKNLAEIAKQLDVSVPEALEKVIVETKGTASKIYFCMLEDDMLRMIKEIDIAIGSDGSGLSLDPDKNEGKPHPRNFGTFPRFLKMARENHMMSVEDAVYKMTGLPAEILDLKDRGVLKEGYFADLTIFNPDTVSDKATYKNPFQKPIGIEYVIVNGEIVVSKGEQTEYRPGKFLLKK